MKNGFKLLSVIVVMLCLFTGCSHEKDVLRLGSMPTYSAAIYAVGIDKGFFEEAGVLVDLTVFRSARDRDAGATAGELDGFMTDIMGAINLNAKGFPFVMTSGEYEDFGLMAGPDVDVEAVIRPTTGISENTVIEYVIDTYIQEELTKVNMLALPDRMGALLSGELEFGVFPEPFMGIVKSNGGQVVFNTAAVGFQPVVLVFEKDYLDNNEKSVKAFYKGYKKTIEYMQSSDVDDYKDVLLAYALASQATVDLYKIPAEEYGLYRVDEQTFNDIKLWMENKKLLETGIEFEQIYTSKFVE